MLGKVRNSYVPCRFCGRDDHDGHLFWECTFPPLVEIRENPEFHDLMEMDKSFWPRCLLWHGWLPLLSGANLGSPWARDLSHGAANLLECALGSYSSSPLHDWRLPVGFDAEAAALQVARNLMFGLMGVELRIDFLLFLLLVLVFYRSSESFLGWVFLGSC